MTETPEEWLRKTLRAREAAGDGDDVRARRHRSRSNPAKALGQTLPESTRDLQALDLSEYASRLNRARKSNELKRSRSAGDALPTVHELHPGQHGLGARTAGRSGNLDPTTRALHQASLGGSAKPSQAEVDKKDRVAAQTARIKLAAAARAAQATARLAALPQYPPGMGPPPPRATPPPGELGLVAKSPEEEFFL